METLKLGERLKTREPQVLLDPELRPGRYRVQLVIESALGTSAQAELEVIVTEGRRIPTGPLTPARPLTPVRPIAPIARVTEIPAADLESVAAPAPAKLKSKAKKKPAKAPAKPKPVKPKRK